jgi:transposase-like protein
MSRSLATLLHACNRYCQVNPSRDVMDYFLRHNSEMRISVSLYRRHHFPAEIISHCVWLYFRFALSFRDVEEMMASRGVPLSYESVREWCLKFGQTYANGLRRKSPRPGDQWHLDEVFLRINGRLQVRHEVAFVTVMLG